MNIFKPAIFLLGGIVLLSATASSQFKFEKATLVNKENGLPTNGIRCLHKGYDGFVWIGSDGLSRFDGYKVKVYQTGKDPEHSLPDNGVQAILSVKNEVWVGTGKGISVLNTITDKFRHYKLSESGKVDSAEVDFDQTIYVLYEDKQGTIWVGTKNRGVFRYDKEKDNFIFYPLERDKFPPLVPALGTAQSILSLRQSATNDSIIWAGTSAGLLEINKYNKDVKLYTFEHESKDFQVALNAFRRLYHHDDGLLYVGSWAASVNVFDPVTKTFTPLPVKNEEGKKILNSVIGNIIRKSDHEIWISTGSGLALYDTKLKDVTWLKFNNPPEYQFYAIHFIDDANRVWHADISGVNYYDPAMQQFTHHSFKDLSSPAWAFAFYIMPDKTGNIITVCPRFADGIYHFNKLKNEWRKVPYPSNFRFDTEREAIKGCVRLPSGDYILAADKGMFLFSEKKNKIEALSKTLPFAGPTRRGEILLDRSANLWMTDVEQGLIRWKTGTTSYTGFKEKLAESGISTITDRTLNLFEDSRGNLWFSLANGYGIYLAAKDTVLAFPYSKNGQNSLPSIEAFAEDKNGRVWISSTHGWLGYALSGEPLKGVVYKTELEKRGLASMIYDLATDPTGEVWGYTTKELVKINARDLSFSTYSFQYGTESGDFFHFSFLSTGEIVFGGRNEITLANPAELKRNTELPVPYIDELQVMNQPYELSLDGTPVKLKHYQNNFSIAFSALAYTMAKDVKFRYRLKGFDDWTEIKDRRFVNYTNVPGGSYVFQLQAANNEGKWNEEVIQLPIKVAIPFWSTWWFRGAGILVLAFAIYRFYRYRLDQAAKKQKLKSEYEKKLANVEMSALLAQMNPHFLFNSLNSIDSYIIRNESKKASEYLNNFARLMRLILQHSRSNYISLKDELEALELYLQMESLRFNNKFEYSIMVDEKIDQNSILIPPMLVQPYVENAIWHGLMHKTNGETGRVEIELFKIQDNLVCIIRDNGIGRRRSAELRARKFNGQKRSMGTQITEERIEIINKLYNINAAVRIIDMENEAGESKGTRVELSIPV